MALAVKPMFPGCVGWHKMISIGIEAKNTCGRDEIQNAKEKKLMATSVPSRSIQRALGPFKKSDIPTFSL